MTLQEIQVIASGADYALRRQFTATAAVVEAALKAVLPPVSAGATGKVVVELWDRVPAEFPRLRAVPPDGRDGDDVDIINNEFGFAAFFAADQAVRRRMVLDALCRGLVELAEERGWDPTPVREACEVVRAAGVEYSWASPPRANRRRTRYASAHARIDEQGAFVKVVVRDRNGALVAESPEERLLIAHPHEIKVRTHRLRWEGADRVVLESRPLRGASKPAYRPLVLDVPPHPDDR